MEVARAARVRRRLFIELGPSGTLTALGHQAATDTGHDPTFLPLLRTGRDDTRTAITTLAHAWTAGATIDPDSLIPQATPTELPTYAFHHQHFWLDRTTTTTSTTAEETRFWSAAERGDVRELARTLGLTEESARASLAAVVPALGSWSRGRRDRDLIDSWRYRSVWVPVAGPAPAPVPTGTWLLVAPADGGAGDRADDGAGDLAAACSRVLSGQGCDVRLVEVDTARADRAELADQVTRVVKGATPTVVLNLLGLDAPRDGHEVPAGVAATLLLLQALHDTGTGGTRWSVTRGAVATGPDDTVTAPAQAQLWGLGRVAGLEDPQHGAGLVDLPGSMDHDATAARLVAAIAAAGDEDELAIRGDAVRGRRLVPAPLVGREPARPFTPRGTALITGGTGGLGGHVARWLAAAGVGHLLLVSRQGPDAPGAAELRAELTGLGAQVTIQACDVGDRAALAALLAGIPADQPLRTVVHAAGLATGDRPVLELTPADLAGLYRSKVAGAAHLHDLLGGTELDAFVLFSSIAAVWGSAGQAGYAAANAYLTALAELRRASGQTATAICWGAWAGAGMASDPAVAEWLGRSGTRLMDPERAIAALGQAIEYDDTAITVAAVDRARLVEAFNAARRRPLLAELAPPAEAPAPATAEAPPPLVGRLAALPAARWEPTLMETVRTEAAAVLGYASSDDIDAELPFRDLGFDSLAGVELKNRLVALTGLDLPATLVFDHPTPAELAGHLTGRLRGDTQPTLPDSLEELRRLEVALESAAGDEELRREVTGRLRRLLDRWSVPAQAAAEAELPDLDQASDDEVFDLLDRELGTT